MQIKGIKVEWTQTFEHHCTSSTSIPKFEIPHTALSSQGGHIIAVSFKF